MMQLLCKYYIEISRYRDAIGYIREALDITQLHFSNRRIAQFMLLQINADQIAHSLPESTKRLKLTENLLNGYDNGKKIDLKNLTFDNMGDPFGLRNLISLTTVQMSNEIKLHEHSGSADKLDTKSLVFRLNEIYNILKENKFLNDYCSDHLVETYFVVCNYLKQFKLTNELKTLVKQLKSMLFQKTSDKPRILLNENWYIAEYYCLVFEIDLNKIGLQSGKDH